MITKDNPCADCVFEEGSNFCLAHCPYDAKQKVIKAVDEPQDRAVSLNAIKNLAKNICFEGGGVCPMVELEKIEQLPSIDFGKWVREHGYE